MKGAQGSSVTQPRVDRPWLTRADVPWLGIVLLAAVLIRVVWILDVNIDPNAGQRNDSVYYHNIAHILAEDGEYVDPFNGGLTALRPPGYPITLALPYRVLGWHVSIAQGLNVAFAAVTVALVYMMARRIFDRRVACLGALVLALFPGQIYFSTLVMAETMFAMVFMLVLFLTLVWTIERPPASWWRLLLIGLFIGAATMIRAEGIFLVPVLAGLWILTVRPWRRVPGILALVAIGLVLALTPWTVRNAVQLDTFAPLRSDGSGAFANALDPDAVPGTMKGGVFISGTNRTASEGLRYQLENPSLLFTTAAGKLRDFYKDDSYGILIIADPPLPWEVDTFQPWLSEAEEARWRRLADRYFFAVGSAAIIAIALSLLRRNRPALVLIVAVVGWTLLYSFFRPVTRYHFPLGPVISIMAGAFIIFIWDGALVAIRRLQPSAVSQIETGVGVESQRSLQ